MSADKKVASDVPRATCFFFFLVRVCSYLIFFSFFISSFFGIETLQCVHHFAFQADVKREFMYPRV